MISDSLTKDGTGVWRDTTRIVPGTDAYAAISDLKNRDGRDILVFGSRVMWNDLLAAGLVDELHLFVGGIVLGGGTPAFPQGTAARLELLETRTFEGSDNFVVRYAVARS